MGSAPAPAMEDNRGPGRPNGNTPAGVLWLRRPPGDYRNSSRLSFSRNVRECCVPRGPKSPVERCRSARYQKQLFPCESRAAALHTPSTPSPLAGEGGEMHGIEPDEGFTPSPNPLPQGERGVWQAREETQVCTSATSSIMSWTLREPPQSSAVRRPAT